jgi:hypothetical protein
MDVDDQIIGGLHIHFIIAASLLKFRHGAS